VGILHIPERSPIHFIFHIIEDDGDGIPADERDEAFDYGHTTRDEGTGFGLSIVADIVDAHDWHISITESNEGGARFEISGVQIDT
jgi:signal transduction histidine kinase